MERLSNGLGRDDPEQVSDIRTGMDDLIPTREPGDLDGRQEGLRVGRRRRL
jgi:hypothetical protein